MAVMGLKKTGGRAISNYGFADGSARSLKFDFSISPVNHWAIRRMWRDAPPLPLDQIP
jgi:prepilin-type processing-associated H-X9-DG protein